MNCLLNFSTPQLQKIHAGKVRDSIRIDEQTRMIVVTDRLSAFDRVLKTPIPHKGAVLNGIANFWFEKTRHIINNHFLKAIDPNITLVREAVPIRVEMVVRGYLTGSMWRGYQKGQREFSGVAVPDGMTRNQRFTQPIVTPTTKEKSDREISPANLVREGWVDSKTYASMEKTALELFAFGAHLLEERGIILVDTKYVFGLINGEIVLIDRSWYNRSGVERVMGFCTDAEYREFMLQVPQFERMLTRSGIHLVKFWFSVSRDEQRRRFKERELHPLKQWKLSPVDKASLDKWDDYTRAKEARFFETDTIDAPWNVVKSDCKKRARLNAMRYVLNKIPYVNKDNENIETIDPLIVGRANSIYEAGEQPMNEVRPLPPLMSASGKPAV